MKAKPIPDVAQEFLDAYRDPEIDKRLFFEVWSDRAGWDAKEKRHVWAEVRRITYQIAAQKRQIVRRQQAAHVKAHRAQRSDRYDATV